MKEVGSQGTSPESRTRKLQICRHAVGKVVEVCAVVKARRHKSLYMATRRPPAGPGAEGLSTSQLEQLLSWAISGSLGEASPHRSRSMAPSLKSLSNVLTTSTKVKHFVCMCLKDVRNSYVISRASLERSAPFAEIWVGLCSCKVTLQPRQMFTFAGLGHSALP